MHPHITCYCTTWLLSGTLGRVTVSGVLMLDFNTHTIQLHLWMRDQLQTLAGQIYLASTRLVAHSLPPTIAEETHIIRSAAGSFMRLLRVPLPTGDPEMILRRCAHDLRNPLSAVIGFSQYMLDDDSIPPGTASYIHAESNRALFLVDSVTQHIRARAGHLKAPHHLQTFALLPELQTADYPAIPTLSLPGTMPTITADRSQFNYVISALGYIAAGVGAGAYQVQAMSDADRVRLQVRVISALDLADLERPTALNWFAIPGPDLHPWQLALHTIMPILAGHGGKFALDRVGSDTRFTVIWPLQPQ